MTVVTIKNGTVTEELTGHQVKGLSGDQRGLEIFIKEFDQEVEEYLHELKEDLFINILVMNEKVDGIQSEVLEFASYWKDRGVTLDL